MKHRITLLLALAAVLFWNGCSEQDTNVSGPNSLGSIDPTTYVAVGNSLTAGMQSGGVVDEFQRYCFPNLIATQLGTASFVQPLIPVPGTGAIMKLTSITPVTIVTGETSVTPPSNSTHPAPYHNLGIPGAILYDAIDESSIAQRAQQRSNPYYLLYMRDQTLFGKSLIEQALKLKPTVMTFWLGANDVLGYVASGGTRGTNTGAGGGTPQTLPTEAVVFRTLYATALNAIKTASPSTKVIVGTIPNPTVIPLCTVVPRQIPNPQNPTQLLSIYYKKKDGSVQTVGSEDYVLLTAQAQFARGFGLTPSTPLESAYVLDKDEIAIANAAINDFNTIIKDEAAKAGYAVADVATRFETIARDGYHAAGETYTFAYISGGLFSLDGVHPTSRGHALLANIFIEAMNKAYGANIPFVQLSDIPAFPAPTGTARINPLQPAMAPGDLERALSVFMH